MDQPIPTPLSPATPEDAGPIVLALPKGRILDELGPVLARAGVATFVAHGAAQIGVCGADVLMEFDYPEIYAPLDLGIGRCRVSVAEPVDAPAEDPSRWSRITVATKYPNIAQRHFAARGVQAEIVHLNGAMELAPSMGLAKLIVDLVQTGSTLKANGLREGEVIAHVTSRLVVNRTALKTRPEAIGAWIARFRAALAERDAR